MGYQTYDPNALIERYLENSKRCYLITIANCYNEGLRGRTE